MVVTVSSSFTVNRMWTKVQFCTIANSQDCRKLASLLQLNVSLSEAQFCVSVFLGSSYLCTLYHLPGDDSELATVMRACNNESELMTVM